MIGLQDEYNTDMRKELDFSKFPPDAKCLLHRERGFLVADDPLWPRGWARAEVDTAPIFDLVNMRTIGGEERTTESVGNTVDQESRVFKFFTGALAVILPTLQASPEGYSSRPILGQITFEQQAERQRGEWCGLFDKLRSYSHLADRWDGYCAQPPLTIATKQSRDFLCALQYSNLRPTRLRPSVVGGIGVTFRKGKRKSYVEFYNDGTVHALFSDGESEPEMRDVSPTPAGYRPIIADIQEYLNG